MSKRRASKPRNRPWRAPVVALSACIGLAAIAVGLWLHFRSVAEVPYTGPVEHVSTGIIGEYASLIVLAQAEGYFRANGLDVTIKDYPSGPAALVDLLAGKVDTAMGSDFAGVRNSFNGEDLKILATVSKADAFDLVASPASRLSAVGDLKGKKIGVTRKTVGEFYLGQFLSFHYLTLNDVQIVDLPQDQLMAALADHHIDAAVLFEPNAYNARTQLGPQTVHWSVQSGQSIYSLLYSTSKQINARPDVMRRYMKALVQAEQFVRGHDGQSRALVAQRFHYDSAYMNYIWPKFSFELSLDQELLLNMDDEARWAIENNLTTAAKPPNYLNLVSFPALDAVDPAAITIIR